LHLKQGHRQEWANKLTYQDWLRLLNGGWATYPVVVADQASGINLKDPQVQARLAKRGDTMVYIRENLHQPDPLIPNDPMVQDGEEADQSRADTWELVRGKAVTLEKHKTSKYPIQFWLSQFDIVYCRCYEAIRNVYIDHIGQDPEDPTTSFFISSKGSPLIHPKAPPIDWTDFSIIVGCGRVTSHVARKMQSQFITTQEDSVLKEGREYMLCHSNDVDKQYYQDHLRQRALAIQGQAVYRTKMGLEEDRLMAGSSSSSTNNTNQDLPYVDRDQMNRELRGQKNEDRMNLKEYLEADAKRDAAVQPTLLRFLRNTEKAALVEAIILSSSYHVSSQGKLVDIFLTGKNVINKKNASVILRMIHVLPKDISSIKVLRDSLLLYAHMSESQDLRKLEWDWTWKLLKCLHNLMSATGLESKNLLHTLAMYNKDHNNKYILGNPNVFTMVTNWQAQEMVREASRNKTGDQACMQQFLAEKRSAYLASYQTGAQPEQGAVDEHDAEQGAVGEHEADELEQVRIEQEVMVPGYKLFPAHTASPPWLDPLKLELLREYIKGAPEPLSRSSFPTGKAAHLNNLRAMRKAGVGIMIPGDTEKTMLFSLVSAKSGEDTLAQFLQGVRGKGFSGQRNKPPGQGGLVNCIDEWLQGQEDKSVEHIRASVEEILHHAAQYCDMGY
jgi:hypothetical protein